MPPTDTTVTDCQGVGATNGRRVSAADAHDGDAQDGDGQASLPAAMEANRATASLAAPASSPTPAPVSSQHRTTGAPDGVRHPWDAKNPLRRGGFAW